MFIKNIILCSDFKNRELGYNYGVTIINSPAGMLARSVVVIAYTQLVEDISDEPDYAGIIDLILP